MGCRDVAVIGSGVAGLTAGYVLSRHDHVTLYEADNRLGGHAHTHRLDLDTGESIDVDTGFIVHNDRTYPTLLRLFTELGVATQDSDMSMSVRDDETGLEYAGAKGVRGLFPDTRNLVRPRYWRMLGEVLRFHRRARALLDGSDPGTTLTEFLDHHRFSPYFVKHFMTPLVAAVWSCDPGHAGRYPARYLFTFLDHHGMLSVFGSPTWRTVTGGSARYVERIAAHIDEVLTDTRVQQIRRDDDGVCVVDADGEVRYFDAVVVAVHPHQALSLLAEPTELETQVLGAMPYSVNHAQLHTDTSLLPRSAGARASWNYLTPADDRSDVVVTYDMTRLMRLDSVGDRRFLVTLGGAHLVDPSTVIAEMTYEHPLYTPDSVTAQSRLPELDTDDVAFAGAYHGWGFHEDGAHSGLRAAQRLGGVWDDPTRRRTPSVYATTIRHTRTTPVRNTFEYTSNSWYIDLDDMPELPRWLRPFAGFRAEDHLAAPSAGIHDTLRARTDAFLASHGVDLRGGRITALLNARVLGYVFDPLSLYWCHDRDGGLRCVIAEVHNTYGERHTYLLETDDSGHAHTDKEFYVSPFNDVSGRYEMKLPEPDETLACAVTLHREGHAPFSATVRGTRSDVTTRTVLWTQLRTPLAPLTVSARIRIQGIALWARGLSVVPRPQARHEEAVR